MRVLKCVHFTAFDGRYFVFTNTNIGQAAAVLCIKSALKCTEL